MRRRSDVMEATLRKRALLQTAFPGADIEDECSFDLTNYPTRLDS